MRRIKRWIGIQMIMLSNWFFRHGSEFYSDCTHVWYRQGGDMQIKSVAYDYEKMAKDMMAVTPDFRGWLKNSAYQFEVWE